MPVTKISLSLRFWISIFFTIEGIYVSGQFYYNAVGLFLHELAVVILLLYLNPSRFRLWVAVFAVVFCFFGDWIAHSLNLWVYVNPFFEATGTPLAVPFVWARIVLLYQDLADVCHEALVSRFPQKIYSAVIWIFRISWLIYTVSVLVTIEPILVVLFLLFIIPMFVLIRHPYNVIFWTVAAIHGTAYEVYCVYKGAYYYTRPVISEWSLPFSLPLAWGVVGTCIWLFSRWANRLSAQYLPPK